MQGFISVREKLPGTSLRVIGVVCIVMGTVDIMHC